MNTRRRGVREIAWKAQTRPTAHYQTLTGRGKKTTMVCTAIARELAASCEPLPRRRTQPDLVIAATFLSCMGGGGTTAGEWPVPAMGVSGQLAQFASQADGDRFAGSLHLPVRRWAVGRSLRPRRPPCRTKRPTGSRECEARQDCPGPRAACLSPPPSHRP